MGLDNFWSGSVEGDFKVCGGLCSGHGNDSFRGKVYNTFIEWNTGVSLYDDVIDNRTIRTIADKLDKKIRECTKDGTFESFCEFWNMDEHEMLDLSRMFRVHALAGHTLTSWY